MKIRLTKDYGGAGKIAERFGGVDPHSARLCGFLHDISVVFPNQERVRVAQALGIDVLPEEKAFPLIVHQKISKIMARNIFDIRDPLVLDAIGCHTTLKAKATSLDLVLFVADKIEWDQSGTPPYIDEVKEQLNVSLEHSAFAYIRYLWERKDQLKVLHPWLDEAYYELSGKLDPSRLLEGDS